METTQSDFDQKLKGDLAKRDYLLGLWDPFLAIPAEFKSALLERELNLARLSAFAQCTIWIILFLLAYFINDQTKIPLSPWTQFRFTVISIFVFLLAIAYFFRKHILILKSCMLVMSAVICCGMAWAMQLGYPIRSQWLSYFSAFVLLTSLRSWIVSCLYLSVLIYLSKPFWEPFQATRFVMTELEWSFGILFLGYLGRMIWISGFIAKQENLKLQKRTVDLLNENVRYLTDRVTLAEKDAAVGEMARQIAHDIRSPVSALKSFVGNLGPGLTISEDEKSLLQNATDRIQSIADYLLQYKGTGLGKAAIKSCPLHLLLKNTVSEKILEFSAFSKLKIIYVTPKCDPKEYQAEVAPADFTRVISNLINNAVEATSYSGRVTVSLKDSNHPSHFSVQIEDDGKGIPHEFQEKLMTKGFTLGKPDGHGLGLYHAKSTIEHWGGKIKIESTAGVGTIVKIELRYANK